VLLAVSESQSSLRRLAAKLGLSRQAIWALCRRFKERGLEALRDAPRSGRPCRGGARPPRPK
jgi:biotin operon repressor